MPQKLHNQTLSRCTNSFLKVNSRKSPLREHQNVAKTQYLARVALFFGLCLTVVLIRPLVPLLVSRWVGIIFFVKIAFVEISNVIAPVSSSLWQLKGRALTCSLSVRPRFTLFKVCRIYSSFIFLLNIR